MAILVFTKGYPRPGSSRLLFGTKSQDTFSRWLVTTCSLFQDSIIAMGLSICDIGTHSFRKGIATLLSNCPGGPQAVSIWLRAGWSLGAVQGRYIFQGSGGDQFVGRAATGLDLNDIEFASLPPHFAEQVLTLEEWEAILAGYTTFYPSSFRVALPYLLASLVYHRQWLENNLPKCHPLFFASVWTSGLLPQLANKVQLGYMKNSISGMQASGIPPNIQISYRLKLVEMRIDTLSTTSIQELPGQVANEILKHIEVNGAVGITKDQMLQGLDDLRSAIMLEIRQARVINESSSLLTTNVSSLKTFTWGGRFHMVPEGFAYPKGRVDMIWNLWWMGIPCDGIAPLRLLKPFDLVKSVDKTNFSKSKKILLKLVELTGATPNAIASMTIAVRVQVNNQAYLQFCEQLFGVINVADWDDRRMDEASYLTLYDAMMSARKRDK